jgi:hypothetical protein
MVPATEALPCREGGQRQSYAFKMRRIVPTPWLRFRVGALTALSKSRQIMLGAVHPACTEVGWVKEARLGAWRWGHSSLPASDRIMASTPTPDQRRAGTKAYEQDQNPDRLRSGA